jgi:hypothetical protein
MSEFNIDEINNYQGELTLDVVKKWIGPLFSKICKLENTVIENKATIDKLTKRLEDASSTVLPKVNSLPISFASVTKKKTAADREMVAAIVETISRNEKEKSSIGNNLVISGIKPTDNDENDLNQARSVIEKLSIDTRKEKIRFHHIKKKVNNKWEKTSMIKVHLDSVETRDKALESIKKNENDIKTYLSKCRYFVNKDLTSNERITLNKLLVNRNELNQKLEHEEGGKRYGIDKKTGQRYFWVIRDNDLKKFLIKDD